jgi:hypothetical protein
VLLDPTPSERTAAAFPLAPRVAVGAGTRVALLDISKPKGKQLLDVVEARLRQCGAEVRRYAKPGPSRPATEALHRTILADRNAALVVALAD